MCKYLCLDEADRMIGEPAFEEEVQDYLLLTTYCSLLATHYSLLTTLTATSSGNLPLATNHALRTVTAHYSPLTTQYSPLTTN